MRYPRIAKTAAGVLAALALLGAAGGAVVMGFGLYDVSALEQHTAPVYWLVNTTKTNSVARQAGDIVPPADLDQPRWRAGGFALYRRHCEQCHGGPGVAPEPFALGMKPVPTAIVSIARRRQGRPGEMYWVIVNGIKMTGMPAWRYRLDEEQVWRLVAFVQRLPYLTVDEYRALAETVEAEQDLSGQVVSEAEAEPRLPEEATRGEEDPVERGRKAIQQYACTTCHRIPGLTAAVHEVGPPLAGIADRAFIAGVLPNNEENMVRWLRFTDEIAPDSAMPALGVEEDDARDIAAYLATLEGEDGRDERLLPNRGLQRESGLF